MYGSMLPASRALLEDLAKGDMNARTRGLLLMPLVSALFVLLLVPTGFQK